VEGPRKWGALPKGKEGEGGEIVELDGGGPGSDGGEGSHEAVHERPSEKKRWGSVKGASRDSGELGSYVELVGDGGPMYKRGKRHLSRKGFCRKGGYFTTKRTV